MELGPKTGLVRVTRTRGRRGLTRLHVLDGVLLTHLHELAVRLVRVEAKSIIDRFADLARRTVHADLHPRAPPTLLLPFDLHGVADGNHDPEIDGPEARPHVALRRLGEADQRDRRPLGSPLPPDLEAGSAIEHDRRDIAFVQHIARLREIAVAGRSEGDRLAHQQGFQPGQLVQSEPGDDPVLIDRVRELQDVLLGGKRPPKGVRSTMTAVC